MIKLTFCLKRLPHLSHAEFCDYWRNSHGPLVEARKDVLRIRRYVQVHSLNPDERLAIQDARGAPQAFDGVAELWFDSLDDLNAYREDRAIAKAGRELLEDEKTFIDLARSPLWLGTEHELVADE